MPIYTCTRDSVLRNKRSTHYTIVACTTTSPINYRESSLFRFYLERTRQKGRVVVYVLYTACKRVLLLHARHVYIGAERKRESESLLRRLRTLCVPRTRAEKWGGPENAAQQTLVGANSNSARDARISEDSCGGGYIKEKQCSELFDYGE